MAGKESRAVVVLALIANASIAVIKFVAAAISGSAAMLAEGFHSVADTGNQLFLLRGSSASRFLPTPRYAFGRGKESYFWAYMVAVFLFVGGGVVAFMEGLDRVRHPHEAEGGLVFALVVLALAGTLEIVIAFRPAVKEFNRRRGGRKVWRTIRETKDPTLLVVLFEDTVAVMGVTVAAAGLLLAHYTHEPRWDGVASMIIGVMLAATAWMLAVETKSLLVGESASRETRSRIRAAALSVPAVETVQRLLTMHLGPDEILVNMDLGIEDGLSGDELEDVIVEVEQRIDAAVPEATRIFVEPT
ncbi:MAG: cation diffusion facilitator family transporter [Actinobacteria bacterium]|nr:cation diffusion facilitator family transporter [Actinomycetota bacterium]